MRQAFTRHDVEVRVRMLSAFICACPSELQRRRVHLRFRRRSLRFGGVMRDPSSLLDGHFAREIRGTQGYLLSQGGSGASRLDTCPEAA